MVLYHWIPVHAGLSPLTVCTAPYKESSSQYLSQIQIAIICTKIINCTHGVEVLLVRLSVRHFVSSSKILDGEKLHFTFANIFTELIILVHIGPA
jgi:hypothetical protein